MLLKPNVGRALSALGALVIVLSLFMVWYEIARTTNSETTGWQTFTNLRFLILAGAAITVATAAVRTQTRPIIIVRGVIGLVLAVLIFRRVLFPPDLAQSVSTQFGVYVGALAGLLIAAGALVDTGRTVIEAYPNLRRPAVAELGRGRQTLGPGDER